MKISKKENQFNQQKRSAVRLDFERYYLAQIEPDAELQRQAVYQCARDDDLGCEEQGFQIPFQLRLHESNERRPANAVRLVHPALHGRRAFEER